MAREPEEHWIPVDGGVGLHALVFRPEGTSAGASGPVISMAHGFGGLAAYGLEPYARRFNEAGFVVIIHDHRGFGLSGGWPRQDIDPWRQILDWRLVLTYLQGLPGVDPTRLGIWGSSYAGGHVLVLAGSDPRVKAVVSQIPTISGYEQGLRRATSPEARAALQARFNDDERAQIRGAEPSRQVYNSLDPGVSSAYKDPDLEAFEAQFPVDPLMRFDRQVTLRSTLKAQMYDPGVWVPRIAPTPLLMVLGERDVVTPTDIALKAFEGAGEPKRLVTYDGGHFRAYVEHFEETSGAARDWFIEHLL